MVKGSRQGNFSSTSFGQPQQSVGGDQTWQKSGRGVPLCVGRFQFTGSPCSFTIRPVIKGNQPRNYQSVNYWDAAKQIQLLIEAHWLPLTRRCRHPNETRKACELTDKKQCTKTGNAVCGRIISHVYIFIYPYNVTS